MNDHFEAYGGKHLTVALVIPTMDKMRYLSKTLEANSKIGFDEIVVVDSSVREKDEVETLCDALGARHFFAKLDRLSARNMAAKVAKTDWVCVCDDDIVLRQFDLKKFRELAGDLDFMIGGWGDDPPVHYAWIFRREFFLDVLRGYDPMITGGDDLDITLRAKKVGRGMFVHNSGLYKSDAIGLSIASDYPDRWIRNKALYSLTCFPLLVRHPFLFKETLLRDGWRIQRIFKGEPAGRVVFEAILDHSGTMYSPIYHLIQKRRLAEASRESE